MSELPPEATPMPRVRRLGAAVVLELVELIVTGHLPSGQLLPPEAALAAQFDVSRTIIRESVKRLEEKGLVVVAQGRGTHVMPSASWNMLDPQVLSALIDNDAQVRILDELTTVRAGLEAMMAGAVAAQPARVGQARLDAALSAMREAQHDFDAFLQADAFFHFALMEMSGNRLAANIVKSLYRRALESPRYRGLSPEGAVEQTLREHTAITEAIRNGKRDEAEQAMRSHIESSWQVRRLTSPSTSKRRRAGRGAS